MDIETARAAGDLVRKIDQIDAIIAQYQAAIDGEGVTVVSVRVSDPATGRETPLTIPPGTIAATALAPHVANLQVARAALAAELDGL